MAFDTLQMISVLPDGALILNDSGIVTMTNDAANDVLQFYAVGLQATAVVRSPSFADALESARQTRTTITIDVEFRGKPPRQVNLHIVPLGTQGDMLILLRDFTRQQAIEKMRSDFVANASHEMRTPLASILGGIETIQGAAKNDAKARDQFLNTMLIQARRMNRLIDDLLTLSRIELNEHVRPDTRISLSDIARQAKSNLSQGTKDAGLVVELKVNSQTNVVGDADELLQVAQNLLENAIKYGGGGGRIELDCYTHEGHGIFSVRDFGKGIAEIHLPRLTERFYRVSTQESRSRGGTGLGLAIVKHIVQRHRGNLAVTSKEGEGSTFSISIPLAES